MGRTGHILAERSQTVKRLASSHGFDFCGISRAEFLEEQAGLLETWLSRNLHGKMAYMGNHFDKRLDPTKLVPGAKSVISLLFNYSTDQIQEDKDAPKISKYAYGEDYHFVVKRKLKSLFAELNTEFGEIDGRVFVDSAPVMDKVWAAKSGLGWIGKHTNLINKEKGSWFFVAEIISDLELVADGPIKDYCGTCTKCIDACPTDAIIEPYIVDGSRCISYLTIELRDENLPEQFAGQMDNWAFGCDICQDACPWNRFAEKNTEQAFNPKNELMSASEDQWHNMSEDQFRELFKGSPVKRTGFKGLKRNLRFLKGTTQEPDGKT